MCVAWLGLGIGVPVRWWDAACNVEYYLADLSLINLLTLYLGRLTQNIVVISFVIPAICRPSLSASVIALGWGKLWPPKSDMSELALSRT